MAQNALRPFRMGTRRRLQVTQNIQLSGWETADTPITAFQLDKTGFLSALWLVIRGDVDFVGGAAALNAQGFGAFFRSININANLGSSAIWQTSGIGAVVASRGMNAMGPRAVISALTEGVDRTYAYAIRIPIAANDTDQMTLGAINLQDPQIQVNVNLVLAALNSVLVPVGTLANAAATLTVVQEYWDIPDPRAFAMPARSIVRTLEDPNPVALAAGENIYQMPRLGTLLQYWQIITINAIRATLAQVDSIQLRLNKTTYLETIPPYVLAAIAAYNYGAMVGGGLLGASNVPSDIPMNIEPGVFVRDYWHSTGIMNAGDSRDFLDTEEITTTEFITNLPAVSGTSNIKHVRRVAQMLG